MMVCPKCGEQLEDGASFCDNCGTKLNETIFCPDCGKETSTQFEFCEDCGAVLKEEAPATDKPEKQPSKSEKQPPKKAFLYGGIGTALVVVIILITSMIAAKSNKSANTVFYIKDKEIFYTDFSKNAPRQITSKLISDTDMIDIEGLPFLQWFTMLSSDGKTIFFPDRINDDDDGISLYYKNIIKSEDPTKIDSDIVSYHVNDAATLVTYIKSDDAIMYQYDLNKGEKEKIADEIKDFEVSDDGKKIIYINWDGAIYAKDFGKDKEKIDSYDVNLVHVSEDLKTLCYIKEGSLYKKTEGKEKEKISSDVHEVIHVYDSGEIYYIKSDSEEKFLMDYVVDDMKKSDADMIYPDTPTYPSWWDYSTSEEFEAAVSVYNDAYASFEQAVEKYREKMNRDELREILAEETMSQSDFTLYYFNGNEEKIITDTYVRNFSTNVCAKDSPVFTYRAYTQSDFDKVKLSKVENINDLRNMVKAALYLSSEQYVAVGDEVTLIGQNSATDFKIEDGGKTIYFLDDVPEGKECGDLYKVSVSNRKVQKPELYDSDVSTYSAFFIADGQFAYFKDFKNDKGDLYINKTRIDYDVNPYHLSYNKDFEKLTYFTDWDDQKYYGTLKVYEKGKVVNISDDVAACTVMKNGNILYVYDFSIRYYKGDLYLFQKGKTEKIDVDVLCILGNIDSKYRGEKLYHDE